MLLLLLLLLPPPAACSDWVDIDTPASAHLHPSYFDGAPLHLTFSDEFAREGRRFVDGDDARWTSLQLPPSTNFQVNWYNESLAFTRDGKLELLTIHKEVTFPAGNGSFETRYMQSAMLQTWNKFCFSEGLIELRAKLPGKPEQAGLWPAFWLMGNLGRATYTRSTDGLWPWIFDECVPLDSPDCEANQCYSQRISACDPDPGFGMNPYQGRGSPEIDIIEVVPGSGDVVYPPKPECTNSPYRDEATANALALKKPFVSTTLQAAPGFPTGSDQRPPDACVPERGNTSAELQWYAGLDVFSVHNASTHDVVFNIEFFGGSFPDYMGGDGLQIDVVSANTALGSTYWDDYHVYSCEWRPGKQGYIVWLLDGIVQYTLEASVLGTPRPITKDGIGIGTRRGLSVPSEPMYVILNVDISPVWGWKSHSPTTNCDAPCECCYDCKRLECTRCMKTDASGKPYNVRAWFADFCETLPASFSIDWVRVHQPPSSTSVGCSTPSHPTKLWIAAHEESYRNPDQEVPMLAVVPGGGGCDHDARCNSPHGSCVNGACVCSSRQWTGPFCLSQAAGDALACHDFETQARHAYPVVNKSRSQQCAVSPKYNITWLQHLRAAACERAEAEGWSLALQACTDSNATSLDAAYVACSEFARTSHVVRALYSDSDGTECCNTFIIDLKGDLRLQCLRGTTPEWLLLGVPVVFLLAIVVTMTFIKARQQATDVQQHEDPIDLDANGPTIEIADDSPVAQRKLADSCLLWCSEDARNVRRQLAERLRARFGFQASSCAVQLEHLEALVLSHLGTSDGNFGEAVKNLHESVLEHFEHWHLHVSERPVALKASSAAYAKAKMNRCQKQHVSWFLADRNMAHKIWQRQTEDDQLEEILLYLLIWGEAGNLRFMPELLCFLFEIARGHLRAPTTSAVQEGWYLEKIVKPLYSCIFKETYQGMKNGKPQLLGPERMPKFPKNYDDWNEMFWSALVISSLRLKRCENTPLLSVSSTHRWPALADANWEDFFGGYRKSFIEKRWWYGLLASYRRVILLHLATFGVCYMIALPPAWEFNGWRALRVLPLFGLLAPTADMLSWLFECWVMNNDYREKLLSTMTMFLCMLPLCILLVWLQGEYNFSLLLDTAAYGQSVAHWPSGAWVLVILYIPVTGIGILHLLRSFLPAPSSLDSLDANLFFESRTAALAHEAWIERARFPWLRAEVLDLLRMYLFWLLVWAVKMTICSILLLPTVFDAHDGLRAAFSPQDVLDWAELSIPTMLVEPGYVLHIILLAGLWTSTLIIYFTDTLLVYAGTMGFWGGIAGLKQRPLRMSSAHLRRFALQNMTELAKQKLLHSYDGESRSTKESKWKSIWQAILKDLFDGDLISKAEREMLLSSDGKTLYEKVASLKCTEARRRLCFFASSLSDSHMLPSRGVLRTPTLTVLVPHYSETIIASVDAPSAAVNSDAEVDNSDHPKSTSMDKSEHSKSTSSRLKSMQHHLSHLGTGRMAHSNIESIMTVLVNYFPKEWDHFVERMKLDISRTMAIKLTKSHDAQDRINHFAARKWASLRLQTLYRTVSGMMKNHEALELLLRVELPDLSESEVQTLLASKATCLVAMQRYDVMTQSERADAEALLNQFPNLTIAYIEEVKHDAQSSRFYSCLIDGHCELSSENRRIPKFRIELPGYPILGDGKADNQNHAIIFSRGAIIQAIDANQEGYLEESLKLCSALQEFQHAAVGATRGPAIVGFREFIFSHLGLLGHFAANTEACFGTLLQRTMAATLWSRYHYGHPDMLEKCAMMSQGGISKATKGLNLSEDIFAGMDAMLRGHTVVHREYYQVGKGRDMGFVSILGFFSKLSRGAAQMSTSRQAYRLGSRLGLARLCGFYYAHTGYYAGQLHFHHAAMVLLALTFLGAVADGTGVLPYSADAAAHLAERMYGVLFALFAGAQVFPLCMMVLAEHGIRAAIAEPFSQLIRGSPIFFSIQSRCIGHFFSEEFISGGATYVPTGRGLATNRNSFSFLFSSYALICLYPGAELLALLLLSPIACPSLRLGWSFFVFAGIAPVSLLLGPLLFNPRCFELRAQLSDIRAWVRWLCDDSREGWGGYHKGLCARKKNTEIQSFLLPSKHIILSFPLMIISYEAMKPYGWDALELALVVLPVFPALLSALLVLIFEATSQLIDKKSHAPLLMIAATFVIALVAEVIVLAFRVPGLTASHFVVLFTTRYCSWRWIFNSLTCFNEHLKAAFPSDSSARNIFSKRILRCTLELTIAGYAWLMDFLLGAMLQACALLLSFVPLLSTLHLDCLFRTSAAHLVKSAEQQRMGSHELSSEIASPKKPSTFQSLVEGLLQKSASVFQLNT